MSNLKDQCPIRSHQLGMNIQHGADHVIEWENIIDTYGTQSGEIPVIKGKKAVLVMCICGAAFEIDKAPTAKELEDE